jgi:hypothetical protein
VKIARSTKHLLAHHANFLTIVKSEEKPLTPENFQESARPQKKFWLHGGDR